MSGDKTMYRDEAAWLAPQGFACACISYRLAPEHRFPAAVADAQSFVAHARANAEELAIDPQKIVAFGNSSGGHLACMLGLCEKYMGVDKPTTDWRANAVVDICGITDLTDPDAKHFPIAWYFLEQFLGGPYQGFERIYAEASPVTHIGNRKVPFLIVHGDQDDIVPLDQSGRLYEALKKAEFEVSLHVLTGEAHAFSYDAWLEIRTLYQALLRRLVD
jgi:acetyl esterase/lipase